METPPDPARDEPDHTDDPRDQDVGQGYPETQEEGASPSEDAVSEDA